MWKPLGAALLGATLLTHAPEVKAAGEADPLMSRSWSFTGIFGRYDQAALQRGLQVFETACATCHGLEFVAFRTLMDLGYTEDEVREFASRFWVEDGPDADGMMFERPADLPDRWPAPWANEVEAALIHGAVPIDLSLITKSRYGGANYVYSLLQGYDDEKTFELDPGNYWNRFYPGNVIGMAPPLFEGLVDFADGTEATVQQMAADVSHFLMWAAEPKLEERKRLGLGVILYTTAMAGIFYAMNRRLWANIKK
ncbi:MAG: cytochrome c1 [Geminicoccaceae bacterium]|nr:MAG: cytochrome c1 [Geminicoccaceae bacterium]